MIAARSRSRYAFRLVAANVPLFVAIFRNVMLLLGLFGLSLLYIANAKFGVGPFQNVVGPSVLVILGSLLLFGRRALTITTFDYYFAGFAALSLLSHIFADEYLFRMLSINQVQANLNYIITMAVLYRAFFCLVYVAPKLGSRMFMAAGMLALTIPCVLGIMQRFGPGKTQAIHIASLLTVNSLQVIVSAQNGRPTGLYSNPNILGYTACVFAAFVLGWGLRDVKNLKLWKNAAVVGLLGICILCVIACQSRQAIVVLVFAPLAFGIAVRLKALDQRNIWLLGALLSVAAFGLTIAVSTSKSTYLTSITKTGVKKDLSYEARAQEVKKLQTISGEIAAGGSGQGMSNATEMTMAIEHSRYNTEVIDNEWGNMFQSFGIGGLVLLALFYVFTVRDIRQVWQIEDPEARMVAWLNLALLIFNVALAITAVRVSKYESSGFTFEVLGVLSAWRIIGLEKGQIGAHIKTRKVMRPIAG